ncbi:penicillin acylase family protein [Nocardioides taihuensis]|uniref:Penicillin acylase family protein n=1 Tax=Nocardioides taihuensis TaxID=1835606 RepID=A0ABW0BIF7_9ACTN
MTSATPGPPPPTPSASTSEDAASERASRTSGPAAWWRAFRGWPRAGRVASYVAVGLVLVLVAVLAVGVVLVRRPIPPYSGEIDLPGLDADVTVLRDAHGIPQLYGDSVEDLVRAQGYVHAQERFYEMDVRRHVTSGRLSEMFGETTVETDEFVRTLGWRRVAEKELALVEPETRDALEAYADGVNAYLETHSPSEIAVEYDVLRAGGLDYTPEPWTAVDSLAWLKAMAWDLRGNMTDEIDRALALAELSPDQVADLYPPYEYDRHQPIVTGGAVVDGAFEPDATGPGTRLPQRPAPGALEPLRRVRDAAAQLPDLIGEGDGIGSNSWVVDGDHSATGAPILANDPHLGVSVPGVWMQMGLHCRTVGDDCPLDVAGFTFSGVPGVIIGHNDRVAWGFTNLGPDVSDLYLEQVEGDQWLYDGRMRPLRMRTETIEVAGGEDVRITVRSTAHGPLLSDVSDDFVDVGKAAQPEHLAGTPPDGYAVSLAWTALQPAPTADAILALDTAHDWDSFRAAAARFDVPAQNMVYADVDGHIGYQAPGRIPIRQSGNDGYLPAEGWRADDDWTGDYIPFDGLPHVLDPDDGFIVTANQAVVGPDYPYYLTSDWDRGYRSQRIRDLLEQEGELSVDEMAAIQLDARSPIAPALVPRLLDVQLGHHQEDDGQELLAGWDYQQDADSPAAAYVNVCWRLLLEQTFHDQLPEEVWPDGGDRWVEVVERLLDKPDDPWWDDVETEEREERDDVLKSVMLDARDEMTRLQARRAEDWTWGHLHQLDLENSTLGTSGVGPVEALVNRGGWEVGGGSSTVNAAGWDAREGYTIDWAPSMRMVVSLADLDDSRWINLTGVSGHPFSSHYTDQTDLWVRGETLAWPFSRERVEAATEDELTLRPAPDREQTGG